MKKEHLGETIRHISGAVMTIVAYRGCNDVDILFKFQSGAEHLAEHKRYGQFTPFMKYPSSYDYLGMKSVHAVTGKGMEITGYRSYKDITVTFEDGGVNPHSSVDAFKKGAVADPNAPSNELRSAASKGKAKTQVRIRQAGRHLGEMVQCKNGQTAEIVAWRTNHDMDIRFEDGVMVEHIAYESFKKGTIRHPDIRVKTELTTPKTDRVGETGLSLKTGMLMEIIVYRTAQDLDVRFEDGAVACHKTYTNFKKGMIQYPNENTRLGETIYVPRVGLDLTICGYRSAKDVDVVYEDGTKVCSVNYKMLRKSPPKHPVFDAPKGKILGSIELTGFAFRTLDTPYFYCRDLESDTLEADILTPKQILCKAADKEGEK